MVLATNRYGSFVEVTGTAAEVLQELHDQGIGLKQLVMIADDRLSAVYKRGTINS